ncbi:helix-turn-helix transcriptional regulator [Macrococcus capreoli]
MIICTLKKLMEKENVNQSVLSEQTKISRPTLLQLIRNENQNIKYDTIDELCDFFKIEMNELLLYSPLKYKFISFEHMRSENKEILNVFKKNYYDNFFTLTISIDNERYTFEYDTGDVDIYDGVNTFFWCKIDKNDYEDLLKKGHTKQFLNTFCNLIIKDKIQQLDTPLKKLKDFEFNVEFIIKNSPDYEEITTDLKYLPSDDLISLKEYVTSLLEENKED